MVNQRFIRKNGRFPTRNDNGYPYRRKNWIFPLYPSTEKLNSKGLNSKGIEKLISLIIPQIGQSFPETLSDDILNEYGLISKKEAIKKIHQPKSQQEIQQAVLRLKFEELFYLQLELLIRKKLKLNQTQRIHF